MSDEHPQILDSAEIPQVALASMNETHREEVELVLKGEPLRLEIKGGELEVIKEGKALKLGVAEKLRIAKEIKSKDGQIVYSFTPGEAGEESSFRIVKEAGGKDGVRIIIEPGKEGQPAIAWHTVISFMFKISNAN